MQKKKISKPCYLILNVIVYCICLSGLLWQLSMITFSYFRYEVLSDINIVMPEKDVYAKYLNICHDITHVKNNTVAEELFKRYGVNRLIAYKNTVQFIVFNLTIGEQFSIGLKLPTKKRVLTHTMFIHKHLICNQLKSEDSGYEVILHKNLSYVSVVISRGLPDIDMERKITIPCANNASKYVTLSAVSFREFKLKYPYADNCMDFKAYNLSSASQAMSSCIKNEKISLNRVVMETERHMYPYHRSPKSIFPECSKFDSNECERLTIFSQLLSKGDRKAERGFHRYYFSIRHASQPSFITASKPRIADVDLITYVLGALGSWIGFSFAGINPVPILFQVADCAQDRISKVGLTKSDVRMIKFKITRIECEKERYKLLMIRYKDRISALSDEVTNMKNDISAIKSKVYWPKLSKSR